MPWRKISVDGKEYHLSAATWENGAWKSRQVGAVDAAETIEFIRRTVRQPIDDESATNHKLALLAQAIAEMP